MNLTPQQVQNVQEAQNYFLRTYNHKTDLTTRLAYRDALWATDHGQRPFVVPSGSSPFAALARKVAK